MTDPTHGYTKSGHPVHGKTVDHHASESRYQRFNKRVATVLTERVGTMTTFWIFCAIAVVSLPAALASFAALHAVFPHAMTNPALVILVAWVSSNFIQLVLLPALMVGQNLASAASDARAAKTFEDTEFIKDQVNEHTDGGIKTILDRLDAIDKKVAKNCQPANTPATSAAKKTRKPSGS